MSVIVRGRTFGDWLLFFRREAQMNQEELAEEAGFSRQSIGKWEGNVRLPRNPADARRLAEALGLDDLQTEILYVTAGHSHQRAKEIEKELSSKGRSELQTEQQNRLLALARNESIVRIRSLTNGFVGRSKELEEAHQLIDTLQPQGGYVVITGLAGQGKSSLIAKLIEAYRQKRCVSHFIPVNPPADYQMQLLIQLMARLIVKYDLPTWDVSADTTLPLIRIHLAKLLRQISDQGRQEVIFLDGLDQLKEDQDSEQEVFFTVSAIVTYLC